VSIYFPVASRYCQLLVFKLIPPLLKWDIRRILSYIDFLRFPNTRSISGASDKKDKLGSR